MAVKKQFATCRFLSEVNRGRYPEGTRCPKSLRINRMVCRDVLARTASIALQSPLGALPPSNRVFFVIESIRAFDRLPDVLAITAKRFEDERGWFSESWSKRNLLASGIDLPEFVQDNHSMSFAKGTVRGLHFQAPPHAQGKLVRCGRGSLFDVAVDVRRGSPTYGEWVGEELTVQNGVQLWIPAGFLHGFVTLEDDTEIVYKCTDFYSRECDGAVRWDSVGIEWPMTGEVKLSEKDAAAQPFDRFESPFSWEG